jgi:hypothetical protein
MTTLISLEQEKRLRDKEDLKKKTQVLHDLKQVNKTDKQFQQSTDSINDTYMKDALSKVRESNVSIDTDLSRFNGTYLYTESQKDDDLGKKLDDLEKEVISDLEKISNTPKKTKKTKSKVELTSDKPSLKQQNEELTWDKILEQVGHKRVPRGRPTSFFGMLRESLQTKEHRKLSRLKESTKV